MDSLFALLFLASLILLIIGWVNPKRSLFWDKQERTKKRSSWIYGSLTILFFILFGAVTDKTDVQQNQFENDKTETTTQPTYQPPSVEPTNPSIDSLTQARQALEQ